MENLFYDRRFTKVGTLHFNLKILTFLQIYDLKGSTRNRHVRSTGRENEVLLDENLVEGDKLSSCLRLTLIPFSCLRKAILSSWTLQTYPSWRTLQRQQVFSRYQCHGLFTGLRSMLHFLSFKTGHWAKHRWTVKIMNWLLASLVSRSKSVAEARTLQNESKIISGPIPGTRSLRVGSKNPHSWEGLAKASQLLSLRSNTGKGSSVQWSVIFL